MSAKRLAALVPVICVLFVVAAEASMVRKMDLAEMCDAAGRIFRGAVVDIDKGTVAAGGGDIPSITYRIRITEQFKGSFPEDADGNVELTLTMVNIRAIEMPRLSIGQDYLLLTTAPSAAGLSSVVGLGQGTFHVYGDSNNELAVNEINNAGLTSGARGPVPYQELAKRIRDAL